jgi:zinc transporter ZupT
MLFASTTPIATFLMAMISMWVTELNKTLLPAAFAFSAGTFLYVSITHIVPEIGSDLRAWHLLAMLVGILIPYFCFIDADHAGD